MHAALPLAALLLTAGVALAPDAAARDCGGLLDIDCDSTYCTHISEDGCEQRVPVHCPVYADPTIITGAQENFATVLCYLLDAGDEPEECQDPVDVSCQRVVCAEPTRSGCNRYEERTCILYARGAEPTTDLTCLPSTTPPLPNA